MASGFIPAHCERRSTSFVSFKENGRGLMEIAVAELMSTKFAANAANSCNLTHNMTAFVGQFDRRSTKHETTG